MRLDAVVHGNGTNKKKVLDTSVKFVDGVGRFRVPKASLSNVQLDPLKLMLSRDGEVVQREAALTCEQKKMTLCASSASNKVVAKAA